MRTTHTQLQKPAEKDGDPARRAKPHQAAQQRNANALALSQAAGNQALACLVGLLPTSPDKAQEQEADQAAAQASGVPAGTSPLGSGWHSSEEAGHVRLHTGPEAAALAQGLHARAFTIGSDIYFGAGQYAPHNAAGQQLLAHELTHTRQQQQAGQVTVQRKELDEELDEELAKWAEAKGKETPLNPKARDYAFTLQEYEFQLVHSGIDLLPKPKGKKEQKEWEKKFRKAHLLGLRILQGSDKVEQKEIRAGMVAQDLANSGFISESMEIANRLTDKDQKKFVYELVLQNSEKASASDLRMVTLFFANSGATLADHPLMTRLKDRSGDFSRQMGETKLNVVLDVIISKYRSDPNLADDLAEILVFNAGFREPFSKWLWIKDKHLLFAVLQSKYFIEPGYGPTQLSDAAGAPREMTMQRDMPWVYTYKQKYYVDHLVALGAAQGEQIPQPKNLEFATLRKWLDDNTEKIGAALAKAHPANPASVTETYEKIADIFFHHVDRGNVQADRAGKLAKLPASDPRKLRLKADCDVLATYATRLLKSSGFIPVGYLAIFPSAEAGHAVALLQKGSRYYVVNNKEVSAISAATKEAAVKKLRDDALSIYDSPTAYKIYYDDAGPGGEMTKALAEMQESTRRKDLE